MGMLDGIYENIEPFYAEGKLNIILGKMGTGKTDFSLTLSEIAIVKGNRKILTNIFVQPNKNIIIIRDDILLLSAIIKYKKDMLLLLDETGIFANSKEAMKMKPLYLEKLIFMHRHFGLSMIWINQREMATLPSARNLATYTWYKQDKKHCVCQFEGHLIPLENIRKTNIPYDTYSFASFRFCLDWNLIYDEIGGLSYKKALKVLQDIIDNKELYYNKDYKKYVKEVSKQKEDT